MKQCPRCGHDLNSNDKFCPHCGLDLQGRYRPIKKKTRIPSFFIYLLVFSIFAFMPLFYTIIFSGFDIFQQKEITEAIALPDMENKEARLIVGSYDTLADFQKDYLNVDGVVEKIKDYENNLSQDGKYTFDKSYSIQVLDNYDIAFHMEYETQINDQLSVVVERKFNRSNTYNDETFSFKKIGSKDFNELFFNEEEMNLVYSFTGKQDSSVKLMNQFKQREAEFNKTKEKLGHYGIGEYDGDNSFVVYRQDKSYYSKLVYYNKLTNQMM